MQTRLLLLVFLGGHCAWVAAKTVPASSKTMDTRACLPPHDSYPFCDTSRSIDERVTNLISLIEESEIPPLLSKQWVWSHLKASVRPTAASLLSNSPSSPPVQPLVRMGVVLRPRLVTSHELAFPSMTGVRIAFM